MINVYQPSLGDEELDLIREVFESNWIGYGHDGGKQAQFIKKFAGKLVSSVHNGVALVSADPANVVAVTSCTEALFRVVDYYVSDGDEVIMPSISFVAAANAVVQKNAIPVFCDVDKHSLNPSVQDIEQKITDKTKAVIILHYAGVPCDVNAIKQLCDDHGIVLIEDNANSPFSFYKGKSTGLFGHVGLWSFDPMKVITAGDCGMIYSEDEELLEHVKYKTYLGLKNSGSTNPVDNKWWEFNVELPGAKATINDIAAAIGIAQLDKVDGFIRRRRVIHDMYTEHLTQIRNIKVPSDTLPSIRSSYYMYHIQLESEVQRNELAQHLRANGIYTTFRYYPLHLVEYYKDSSELPNSEWVAKHTLCLPIHQSLTDDDITCVVNSIKEFFNVN